MEDFTTVNPNIFTVNESMPSPDDNCTGNQTAFLIYYTSMLEVSSRLQTGVLVSYLLTMIVGLTGNSLVIHIIARNSQTRNKSVANYYIWNLALADLFFVLMLPFYCYATYYNDWPFGSVMCKVSQVFNETNRYVSMFTLVALSFDRYLASFYNMGYLRTVKIGIIVCVVIWIFSLGISVPYWLYVHTIPYQNNSTQCVPKFGDFKEAWTYIQLFIALVIPLVLICASYILLALRLHTLLKASTAKSASVQKPSRKMMRTILVVVITFLVCQAPYHANEIVNLEIGKAVKISCWPTATQASLGMYLSPISTILVFFSSCCNPIIYGILNDNYRKLYRAALCCCLPKSGNTVNGKSRLQMTNTENNPQVQVEYREEGRLHSACLQICLRRCCGKPVHQRMGKVNDNSAQTKTEDTALNKSSD